MPMDAEVLVERIGDGVPGAGARSCRDEALQVARLRCRQDSNIQQDRSSGPDFGSATLYSSGLNINRNGRLGNRHGGRLSQA